MEDANIEEEEKRKTIERRTAEEEMIQMTEAEKGRRARSEVGVIMETLGPQSIIGTSIGGSGKTKFGFERL